MVKYLSGRVKRTPQDQLKDDRYQYLNLEQAEPNLSDPLAGPTPPPGGQYQLIAIPGYPGQRFWVPVGGGLIPGAITIFDEGVQVSAASSITQLNFVGAAVTANVSVQSPSGNPGIAATVTVIPVTVGNEPPTSAKNGELWWESDTGDLFVRYDDPDSSQWVMANAGGRGPEGDKGEKGDVEAQGNKGEKGIDGQKGEVGDKGDKGEKGDKGDKGEVGEKGFGEKGVEGDKGNEGEKGIVGDQGAKAGLIYRFSTVIVNGDPGQGIFRFNNTSVSNVNQLYIDILEINSVNVLDQLLAWDDSNSAVAGYLYVTSNDNSDNTLAIFEITSATNSTGYVTIGVQNGFGNIPSNQELCVLNFSRTGDKGQKGDKGSKGEIGEKGIEGLKGEKGEIGEKGTKGEIGDKGDKGNDGDLGVQGDKGEVGEKGDKGDKGNDGDLGVKGDKGDKGEIGDKGDKGADSTVEGQKGEIGEKGSKGEIGEGDKGDKGDKGEKGTGDKGEAGTAVKGEPGSSTKGEEGEKGQKGELGSGDKGEPGAADKGEPGSSTKGEKGDEGDKGQKGESGSGGGVAGSDKQVQFNDNGSLAGADGLEFHKSTTIPQLILKPSSSDSSTYGDGNIMAQTKDDTYGIPYNRTVVRSDGGLELMRRRVASPHGGPYIDFTSQLASGNGDQVDFDARIQMDYGTGFVVNQPINPNSDDYSAITFQTGGNSYYSAANPTNTQGRVIERLRIGKAGEIGIEAGPYIGNGNVANNRTDAQKYGTTGQVLTSNGKGSSVSWETVNSGSSITINSNINNNVITATGTANTLQGEGNLTWDGGTLLTNHNNGRVDLSPSNGCIEITRTSGSAFIDFKNLKTEDFDIRIQQNGTNNRLDIYDYPQTGGDLSVRGNIINRSVAKVWAHFGGASTMTNYSNHNVSSYTYYGTGDYQVNYANQLTDSAGNATDYQSVSFCITGSVYAVSGQFAHTHPFIYSGDKNHVRFICHKTVNSNQRAEQPYVGVIVFS